MNKVDRAIHGPGWGEVILGAVLSFVLGVVLGALLLIFKPVVVVKDIPKEPVPGTVYYIEGLRSESAGRQAMAKRKALVEGQAIKLTEQELNALAHALAPTTTAAKPDQKAGGEAAKPDKAVTTGMPNVRIREGVMQIGVPVTISVLGVQQNLIAQARGGFSKEDGVFVYDPDEMYLGSCPVQRLPFVSGYIRSRLTGSAAVPDDIATAWRNLSNVSLEGRELSLTL